MAWHVYKDNRGFNFVDNRIPDEEVDRVGYICMKGGNVFSIPCNEPSHVIDKLLKAAKKAKIIEKPGDKPPKGLYFAKYQHVV